MRQINDRPKVYKKWDNDDKVYKKSIRNQKFEKKLNQLDSEVIIHTRLAGGGSRAGRQCFEH